jgi:two-component system chemotaxis response regulator CheY
MAKILVVDDAGIIRRWCNRTLSEYGHEVIEAADGREAVQLYLSHRPDGVLLDVTMPVMNGLAALDEIMKLDPEARVAMLTVMGQMETVVESKKLGARDFVLKPCEATRLVEAVNRILR